MAKEIQVLLRRQVTRDVLRPTALRALHHEPLCPADLTAHLTVERLRPIPAPMARPQYGYTPRLLLRYR
jgi:hypothetical protein